MDWIGYVRQPKHEVKYGPDNYLGCCSIDVGISFLTGLLSLLLEGLNTVKGLFGKNGAFLQSLCLVCVFCCLIGVFVFWGFFNCLQKFLPFFRCFVES